MNKVTVFTWGYDPRAGKRYLDNYIVVPVVEDRLLRLAGALKVSEIAEKLKPYARALQLIRIRMRVQGTHMAVVRGELSREECEALVRVMSHEELLRLRPRAV